MGYYVARLKCPYDYRALFQVIFGESQRVVTSEELHEAGFDDSKEPDISNYYDYL
jgi:hypothetical protein